MLSVEEYRSWLSEIDRAQTEADLAPLVARLAGLEEGDREGIGETLARKRRQLREQTQQDGGR